jgi:hypothetical protein
MASPERKGAEKPETVSLFAESTIEHFRMRWTNVRANLSSCLTFNTSHEGAFESAQPLPSEDSFAK